MYGEFAVKNGNVNVVKKEKNGWGVLIGSLLAASVILGFMTTMF